MSIAPLLTPSLYWWGFLALPPRKIISGVTPSEININS